MSIPVVSTYTSIVLAAYYGLAWNVGNFGGFGDYPNAITKSTGGSTGTAALTSAINFPRLQIDPVGGIYINNPSATASDQLKNTEFVLPTAGIYRISWTLNDYITGTPYVAMWYSSDAAGNIALPTLGGGGLFTEYKTSRFSSTPMSSEVMYKNTLANSAIQIRNSHPLASGADILLRGVPNGNTGAALPMGLIIERKV